MGKTNLLDAIYYTCMGKSHFRTNDRNIVRHDQDFFRLEAYYKINSTTDKIVVKVVPGKTKTIERNDNAYGRIADHVGLLPVVFKAPDDTALAMEGSEDRRRFLDNTLCQINHQYLEKLITYNKVLASRNALLKQFAESNSFNQTLLTAFDQQLLEPASYLREQRVEFSKKFKPIFQQYYLKICGGTEEADCTYKTQLIDKDFQVLLSDNQEKDRILQRTTVGIHKDELIFNLDGFPVKRFASQGQLKSFILSLKLAQYHILKEEKGIRPILLLDDLFDKLDERRVSQLIELLMKEEFGQVFITETSTESVEAMARSFDSAYKRLTITNGKAS